MNKKNIDKKNIDTGSISINIEKSWSKVLSNEYKKKYFQKLKNFLNQEKKEGKIIYPHSKNIFAAFNNTPFDAVKVVIIGQDPYHGKNQAHGLSFSVPKNQSKIPPSLQNIFKEIKNSCDIPIPLHGNLEHWAKQGVLLLNATLTVEAGNAGSHQKKGWEIFTGTVIQKISALKNNVIFVLWGIYAQQKVDLIDQSKHSILQSSHPSPLSAYRGFLGCNHFKIINQILETQGSKKIIWGDK